MKHVPFTLACAFLSTAALAGGGTVVKVDGKASIDRKGSQVNVSESTPIYSGDSLNVADKGSAQLRMEDDSIIVVPGSAVFKIDHFQMAGRNGPGKAIYTIKEGGMRTLTGKVSKGAGDKYETRAEEGTITVQGSAYMALRCNGGGCAAKFKKGLYVKAESGTVTVANAGGSLKLHRGQVAYAATKTSVPVHVKVSPFNDPMIAAQFGINAEFDAEVHPPRIEQEPPASPS